MSDRKAARTMQGARGCDEVASRKHLQAALELTDGRLHPPVHLGTVAFGRTYTGPVKLSCSHKALFGTR